MSKSKIFYIIFGLLLFLVLIIVVLSCLKSNEDVDKLKKINAAMLDIPSLNKSTMREITVDDLEKFGIDKSYIKGVVGKIPILDISSSMYIVLELNDKKYTNIVTNNLKDYVTSCKEKWEDYMEDQYNLVKDSEISNNGVYVYLIISDDKADIEKIIKNIL